MVLPNPRQVVLGCIFFTGILLASPLAYDIIPRPNNMHRTTVLAVLTSSFSCALGQWSIWGATASSGSVTPVSQPSVLSSTAATSLSQSSVQSTAAAASSSPSSTSSSDAATYTNPILNEVGADPWVIRNGDYYYMTYTTSDNVTLLRSSVLTSVALRTVMLNY